MKRKQFLVNRANYLVTSFILTLTGEKVTFFMVLTIMLQASPLPCLLLRVMCPNIQIRCDYLYIYTCYNSLSYDMAKKY